MSGSSPSSRDGNIFGGIVERSQRKKPVKLAWGMIGALVLLGMFVLFGLALDAGEKQSDAKPKRQEQDPDALMTTPWANSDEASKEE